MRTRDVEDRLRAAAAECDGVAERMEATRPGRPPDPTAPAGWSWGRGLLVAAVALVAVGAGIVALAFPGDGEPDAVVLAGDPASTSAPSEPESVTVGLPDGTMIVVGDPEGVLAPSPVPSATIAVAGDDAVRPFDVLFLPGEAEDWAAQVGADLTPVRVGVWTAVRASGHVNLLVQGDGWFARVLTGSGGQQVLPAELASFLRAHLEVTVDEHGPSLAPVDGVDVVAASVSFRVVGATPVDEVVLVRSPECTPGEQPGQSATRCFLEGTITATGYGAGEAALDRIWVEVAA